MPQTFSFNKHVLETEYPESGSVLQFGKGYQMATKPKGPDQVIYTLHFDAMRFYFTSMAGTTLDKTTQPTINMGVLEDFYNYHRLYEPFIYPHDTKGNLNVRFKEPLKFKILKAGRGVVEPFQIRLILLP